MKLFTKLGVGLTAIILSVSLVLPNTNYLQTVQAAKKKKNTIRLWQDAYVYNKHGHKIKEKKHSAVYTPSKLESIAQVDTNGYLYLENSDLDDWTYSWTKIATINGQKYYYLGNGAYINAAYVSQVNGRNSKKGKLVLDHAARVYQKNGKKTNTVLTKNTIIKYTGKVKYTSRLPKYFYYTKKNKQAYLPTHKIKGKNFYSLGHNRYINAYNVGNINGEIARYNGVTYAIVNKTAFTQDISNGITKHKLKKGQKIKIDLAVIPWSEDFYDYIFRLHDYPDEYIEEYLITPRKQLPISDYDKLSYTHVKAQPNTNIQLYDVNGKASNYSIKGTKENDNITVDGLFYIYLPNENKAELFYHYLYDSDEEQIIDKTEPATTNGINKSDKIDQDIFSNSFIKASDVKYDRGIKLDPLNTIQNAQTDQKVATAADKKELKDLFAKSQNIAGAGSSLASLEQNYHNAIINAATIIRDKTATINQVNEAVWLLKLTEKQLSTLDFEPWS
ncbi:SLAP domain-containing protein [Lactobacillus sp. ESL0791]|uniref:SLAP domain-containing protein n=1 Tax=Lactobacillus sp. ESL0791 TaxID=2983234 RepID=UPI0023F9FC32|nr:SLAP domain-containing protein [Lactobacillus sp. ESL0791]MDF7637976.1 SLAP domain-containing protein [Lactobacillus sp. ESL0791]